MHSLLTICHNLSEPAFAANGAGISADTTKTITRMARELFHPLSKFMAFARLGLETSTSGHHPSPKGRQRFMVVPLASSVKVKLSDTTSIVHRFEKSPAIEQFIVGTIKSHGWHVPARSNVDGGVGRDPSKKLPGKAEDCQHKPCRPGYASEPSKWHGSHSVW